MTLDDVKTIQAALTELGIAIIRDPSEEYMWTLHQRRVYEAATQILKREREKCQD